MKMKIPIVDPSSINSSQDSSSGDLSSDNSEAGPPSLRTPLQSPLFDMGVEGLATEDGNDFSEYLWMENEEEFDKQILQQLEEEALMEQCLEVMLEHEIELAMLSQFPDMAVPPNWNEDQQNGSDLCRQMSNLKVQDKDELAKQSTLNPNAAEFIPQSRITTGKAPIEKTS